ncbi:MAG: M48 family metalloprotease [Acidobacteria bacterium]|nr:M48 family metalloprotease [Acidobacteriota bacterium]
MRILPRSSLIALGLLVLSPAPDAQQLPSSGGAAISMDALVDRLTKAESALTARMSAYRPVVEVYLQHLVPDAKVGAVPRRDDYFLGQFDGNDGPSLTPLGPSRGWFRPAGLMNRPFGFEYVSSGFAATIVPDRRVLDRARYEFTFVRREFLNEVRCLVLDVQLKDAGGAGFKGRIWVEDRDFTIVRFNGISREIDASFSRFFRKKLSLHVDSWRVNVLPGVWLPAYVYFEETDFQDRPAPPRMPRIKGQMRLWGYELKDATAQSAFTTIQVDQAAVQDSSEQAQQLSPVLSQRRWEQQAESNVLDRLTSAGLLAPVGPVDGVLETVLNNLQVTSNVTFDPPLKARVLLTSPLESFTVGRTIVVSRGLIDVLPDEASLAMVLGHELAHVILGHQLIDTKFGFADRLMIPDTDVVRTLRFNHTLLEESAADAKLIELLGKSPYQEKLSNAGLFVRAIVANAKTLPNLIQPHMGDYVVEEERSLAELIQKSPELAPEQLDQIAVLPLGARLVMDPWSNRLDLNRTPAVPLTWAREKLPLAITPMAPYLRYADPGVGTSSR